MDDAVVRAVNVVIGGQDRRASTAHHGGRDPAFGMVLHVRSNAEYIGMKQRGLPWGCPHKEAIEIASAKAAGTAQRHLAAA